MGNLESQPVFDCLISKMTGPSVRTASRRCVSPSRHRRSGMEELLPSLRQREDSGKKQVLTRRRGWKRVGAQGSRRSEEKELDLRFRSGGKRERERDRDKQEGEHGRPEVNVSSFHSERYSPEERTPAWRENGQAGFLVYRGINPCPQLPFVLGAAWSTC